MEAEDGGRKELLHPHGIRDGQLMAATGTTGR